MDNLQMDKLCFYVDADEARALKHILQVAESTVLGGLLDHLEKMSADLPEPKKPDIQTPFFPKMELGYLNLICESPCHGPFLVIDHIFP